MMTTIVLDDTERKAVLFVLGGRHHVQLEPHHKGALDNVEARLRDVPIEAESVVTAPEAGTVSPVAAPKAKGERGRK